MQVRVIRRRSESRCVLKNQAEFIYYFEHILSYKASFEVIFMVLFSYEQAGKYLSFIFMSSQVYFYKLSILSVFGRKKLGF